MATPSPKFQLFSSKTSKNSPKLDFQPNTPLYKAINTYRQWGVGSTPITLMISQEFAGYIFVINK